MLIPSIKNSGAYQKKFWCLPKKIMVSIKNIFGPYQKKFWCLSKKILVRCRNNLCFTPVRQELFLGGGFFEKMMLRPLLSGVKIVFCLKLI